MDKKELASWIAQLKAGDPVEMRGVVCRVTKVTPKQLLIEGRRFWRHAKTYSEAGAELGFVRCQLSPPTELGRRKAKLNRQWEQFRLYAARGPVWAGGLMLESKTEPEITALEAVLADFLNAAMLLEPQEHKRAMLRYWGDDA